MVNSDPMRRRIQQFQEVRAGELPRHQKICAPLAPRRLFLTASCGRNGRDGFIEPPPRRLGVSLRLLTYVSIVDQCHTNGTRMGDATAASRGRRRSPRLGCNLESKHTHSHPQLHPKRLACSQRHPQAWPSGAPTWRSLRWMREPALALDALCPHAMIRLLLLSPGCLGSCFELVLLSCRLLRNLMPRYRLCIRKETCHHANPSLSELLGHKSRCLLGRVSVKTRSHQAAR